MIHRGKKKKTKKKKRKRGEGGYKGDTLWDRTVLELDVVMAI